VLALAPNDPTALEFLDRIATALEFFRAWRMWRSGLARASRSPEFVRRGGPRSCGHPTDRRCYCGECQPETKGGRCRKCSGPVWRDDEELCPSIRNPAMLGY
jgi:hypothetical protein